MQARSEKTKERVIRSANALFVKYGLEGVSIQDIAEKSGISNGSIFHHFGSKNGVALEVYLRERRTYWDAVIDAVVESRLAPPQAMGEGVRAALRYQEKYPRRHSFMVECASADWMCMFAKPIREFLAEATVRFMVWAEPHIGSGALKPMPPELYASIIFGMTQYIARSWITGLTDPKPTSYADDLVAFVETGFRP